MDKLIQYLKNLHLQEEMAGWIPEYRKQIWIILILLGAFLLQRLVRYFLKKYIDHSSQQMNTDPTNFKFIRNVARFFIYTGAFVTIIYLIPPLKKVALSIFASAGIIAAAVAFAAQASLANIISGIFLVIFKPIRVNDIVKIGTDYEGVVEDINMRHTVLRDFENRRIIIPNSSVSSATIINSHLHDPRICKHLNIYLPYDIDIERALNLIREVCTRQNGVLDTRTQEEIDEGVELVTVRIVGFEPTHIRVRAFMWTDEPRHSYRLASQTRQELLIELAKNHIHLSPYQRNQLLQDENSFPQTETEKP